MLILYALKQNKHTFASHVSMLNFYLILNLYNTRHVKRDLVSTVSATCMPKSTLTKW